VDEQPEWEQRMDFGEQIGGEEEDFNLDMADVLGPDVGEGGNGEESLDDTLGARPR
jgi:hypothetical protein